MTTKPRKMPVGKDWREPAVQIAELDVLADEHAGTYFSDPGDHAGEAFIRVPPKDERWVMDLKEVR